MSPLTYCIAVREHSGAGEARRAASSAAAALRFSETQQGRVAVVATELATNLAKHSREGQLIVQEVERAGVRGLELLAVDAGPGFGDIEKIMADGYSTAGSPGTGLGAIRRMSASFDAFSAPGSGSVFMSRVWARNGAPHPDHQFDYGVVSVPYPGETANGDSWAVEELGPTRRVVMMVDGLGHGEFAADAARAAVEVLHKRRWDQPEHIIEYADGALRSTRGAALAVASIDSERGTLDYVGVGNIAGAVATDSGVRRMISHEGTVGHSVRKIQKFTYPWPERALLIMHSDGLSARWDLQNYPGLLRRSPSVIAAVLFRDNARKTDDATVLVARET